MNIIELLPWIVLAMIIYDLSVHLVYTLGLDKKILKKRLNWWPAWYGIKYQIFWISYWTLAFVLLSVYLIFR